MISSLSEAFAPVWDPRDFWDDTEDGAILSCVILRVSLIRLTLSSGGGWCAEDATKIFEHDRNQYQTRDALRPVLESTYRGGVLWGRCC